MNTDVMFSSKTDLWETPQEFFDRLNDEFGFDLDVCARPRPHYGVSSMLEHIQACFR